MRVVSKFLTADVRIVRVSLRGRRVVMEGVVKELMPMTVELGAADARELLAIASRGLRARLARRLPGRLGAALAPAEAEGAPLPVAG